MDNQPPEYDVDFQIKSNFSLIVSSVSNSGKTSAVVNFLLRADEIVDRQFTKIIIFCGNRQELYDRLQTKYNVVYVTTIEEAESNFVKDAVILIDDKLSEIEKPGPLNTFVKDLFCRTVHHLHINAILIVQCLFSQHLRLIFNNATYLLVGKYIKDRTNIVNFGKQFCPNNSRYIQESYEHATSKPYGFLFIDLSVTQDDRFRVRNSIFPSDEGFCVYISKK